MFKKALQSHIVLLVRFSNASCTCLWCKYWMPCWSLSHSLPALLASRPSAPIACQPKKCDSTIRKSRVHYQSTNIFPIQSVPLGRPWWTRSSFRQLTWTARRPRSALRMYKISKGQLVILGNSLKKILITKRIRDSSKHTHIKNRLVSRFRGYCHPCFCFRPWLHQWNPRSN